MKLRIALVAVLSMLAMPLVPAPARADGERLALVIGNAKYPDNETPLKEPINDARAVADELKRDGFAVEIGENLRGDAMRRALDKFYGRITPGATALIFFSGFGVQSAGQSYILPVDGMSSTDPYAEQYVAWHFANAPGVSAKTVLTDIDDIKFGD